MGYIEEIRKIVGHRPLILVGAVVIILDDFNRILLEKRHFPKGSWCLPGGLMELGESTEETAKREVYEETGLIVDNLQLFNVYSGSEYHVTAENGDEFYAVTVAYYTKNFNGELNIDLSESVEGNFFELDQLPQNIVKSQRKMLKEFISFYLNRDWV